VIFMFICAWAQDYLSAETVEKKLIEQKDVFSACSGLEDQLHTVRFSVAANGTAKRIEGDECFSILSKVIFPSHPSKERTFIWRVAIQKGVLFPQTLVRERGYSVMLPGLFAIDKLKIMTQLEEKK